MAQYAERNPLGIDTLTMFTSEILVAELNSLADEITYVIPADFKVTVDFTTEGQTLITATRKEES